MLAVLVVLGAVGFFVWASRQRELFCVSVRQGRVLLVRGRIPGGLLSDFADALGAAPAVARATIRAYRDEGGARLEVAGSIDGGRAQRLRNIFALYPMSRLSAAPVASQRTIGQIVGIVWLAWLLERSRSSRF
jgi:hypothetical protein